jgi:hypothetical protein
MLIVIATLLAPPIVDLSHRASAWFIVPLYTEFVPFGHLVQSREHIRVQLSSTRALGRHISWGIVPAALFNFQPESHRLFTIERAAHRVCEQFILPLLRAPPRTQVLL